MFHARVDYQFNIQDRRTAMAMINPEANGLPGGIPANEPVFLLRAQDLNAAEVVRFWAFLAQESGADENTIKSALAQADAMDAWPRKKTPDAPPEQ